MTELLKYKLTFHIKFAYLKILTIYQLGGGGCNPKKPYPSLTFSRVGVGFFWVLLGFFVFFWVFKKLIIFANFLYTQCENMHML